MIPRLVHKGFRGPVYCTAATADLLAAMLPDSANIQEKDAQREHRKPLYSVTHALHSLRQLHAVTAQAFCRAIEQQLGWRTELPGPAQTVEI